jgi:hypothetical protein
MENGLKTEISLQGFLPCKTSPHMWVNVAVPVIEK